MIKLNSPLDGSIVKKVYVKIPIFFIDVWEPAVVSTKLNPGNWVTLPEAYIYKHEAQNFINTIPENLRYLYRICPSTSYIDLDVRVKRSEEDRKPPVRGEN